MSTDHEKADLACALSFLPVASVEERMDAGPVADLAEAMRENLETRGVLERVKYFIHSEVLKTLLAVDPPALQLSADRHLVNALIADYLKSSGYIATLSVFNDENGISSKDVPDLCSLTGNESSTVLGRSIATTLTTHAIQEAVRVEAQQLDADVAAIVQAPVGSTVRQAAVGDGFPPLVPARAPEFTTVLQAAASAAQGEAQGAHGRATGRLHKPRGPSGLLDLEIVRVELGLEASRPSVPKAGTERTASGQDDSAPQPLLLQLVQRAKAGRYREMMAGVEDTHEKRVPLFPQGPYAEQEQEQQEDGHGVGVGVTGPLRVIRQNGSLQGVQAGERVLPTRGLGAAMQSGKDGAQAGAGAVVMVAPAPAPAQGESGPTGSWTPGLLTFTAP